MIRDALSNHNIPAIREYQRNTKKPDLSHIPGDTGLPIINDTYGFTNNIQGMINRKYKKYGSIFRVKVPSLDSVMILGPEAAKLVMQNEGKIFSNFLIWNTVFKGLFDNNILERDFSSHKTFRKILQSAFKREAIEGHMELMNPIFKQAMYEWPAGRTIETMNHVKKCLLDVGANVFLGIQLGDKTDKINQAFIDMLAGTADIFKRKELFFMPYSKGIKAKKTLSKFVFENIDERRNSQDRDILSQLSRMTDDEGELLSRSDIRDQINFLLFAAHDTTTSLMCSVLYSLATHIEWQEVVRKEIIGLNKQNMEFDDIVAMEKTGWTIKEALRMYPPVSTMGRYTLEDVEFDGHTIPANTPVMVSPVFSHFMEEYWSNPHTFDPLRFSPARAEDKNNFYQYVPFSGGAHKCLGMHFADTQGKMFLFHLLKNYRVTKDPKMTKYKFNYTPLTFPTDGLPLTFTKL